MKKEIRNHKDLVVWRKGVDLVKRVYQITASFPADERFGLVSQMRRAAVSIPSNLAEGHARRTTGEFLQFISHSEGSLAELETQVIISLELGFLQPDQTDSILPLIVELQKMLGSLRKRLSQISSP